MSFKSIIDIDINDEKFKSFLESFQRYNEEAKDAPKDWHRLAESISGAEKRVRGFGHAQGKAFRDGRDQVSAASKSLRGYTGSAKQAEASMGAMSTSLGKTTRHQKSFIENVRRGGGALKGFSVDTAASALGLDELAGPLGFVAASVAAIGIGAAKAALGLDKLTAAKAKSAKEMGMTIAQQQAFQNYGSQMFENPNAMMAQIYKAKINPADRRGLLAAGLTNQQISTESTPQIAFQFAKKMRARLMAAPANVREAEWNAITGGQFGGAAQVGLLTNTRAATMAGYQAEYKKHEKALAISRAQALRAVRTSQAASELRGKVTTKLENLSASKPATAMAMGMIREGRILANSVDAAGGHFANAVEKAGAAFSTDIHNILHGKSLSAASLGKTTAKMLFPHDKLAKQGYVQTMNSISPGLGTWWQKNVAGSSLLNWGAPHQSTTNPNAWGWKQKNPGNLRPFAGDSHRHGFAAFSTWRAGYQAMANTLRSYPGQGRGDTIATMMPHYNSQATPAQLARYESEISRWSGLGERQKMNLNNPGILSHLMSAMVRAENGIRISPANVQKELGSQYLDLLQQIAQNTAQNHIHIHTTGSGHAAKVAVSAHAAAR